ncbi:MAG: ferredoxin [Frankiales bacterium]|nr:ferredoxin [Frankiales bacterium]
MPRIARRTALKGAGGLGLLAVTSACGGGGGADKSSSAAGLRQAGALVALAEIEVGSSKVITVNGTKLAVSRTGQDTAVAVSAVCTHAGCTVRSAGAELHCPCHGSQFNATTGAVLHGPAERPLAVVPVRVADGQVVAG